MVNGTHPLVHPQTLNYFEKCLNRSKCGYTMCIAVTLQAVSQAPIPHLCYFIISQGYLPLRAGLYGWVLMLEFTGNSLGCGGLRGAPLCEAQDQTASCRTKRKMYFKNKFHQSTPPNALYLCTYKEYLRVSSNSIIAAWFPQR